MRLHRTLLVLTSVLVVSSCAGDSLGRTPDGLTLVAEVSDAVIARGEVAFFTFAVRNTTNRHLSLQFPNGCQLVPYIVTAAGTPAYPSGGGWGCFEAITFLELAPGAEHVETIGLRGGIGAALSTPAVPLAPGRYRAFARLGVPPRERGQSNVVQFEVVE